MKKIVKAIIALCCVLCVSMGVISCSEIKGKSKIQKVTVTLNVNGDKQDFNFELYLDYAPGTIEHFTDLVNAGYYDNTLVSNLEGHVEFGSLYESEGAIKSKYDADALKSYSSIINADYVAGKTLYHGKDKTEALKYPKYNADHQIRGEFLKRGYPLNELDLNGSLVLKRDVIKDEHEAPNAYDTGKATMAITFGEDSYFAPSSEGGLASSEFAVLGKICSDDAEKKSESSYSRLQKLMTDYKKDSAGNIYYYYTLGTADYYKGLEIEDFGHYFMYDADDKAYYVKGADGKYTKLEAEDDLPKGEVDPVATLLEELETNAHCLNTLAYEGVVITVEKITFSK